MLQRSALLLFLAALVPAGCARGRPVRPLDPASLPALAADAPPAPPRPLAFDEAVRRAASDGPEWASLRKAVEGVNVRPSTAELEASVGDDSDGRVEAGVSFDVLALLGLGAVRGERCLAWALRGEAEVEAQARGREIVGEIAEAYAADAALAGSPPLPTLLEAEAFVRAGLAPAASAAAADAARVSLGAEATALETERLAQRLRVGRHLGLRPEDAPKLVASPSPWPAVPEPDAARLLAVDPGVRRRLAAHEVARAALAKAQAGLYPSLVLSPSIACDPTYLFGSVGVRLPIGARAEVRAAAARLEAVRLAVKAAVLEALETAAAARGAWSAAERSFVAARARFDAAHGLADAERARVETQGEGFTEAVLSANAVVDASRDLREAAVAAARARVRAALAAGWPPPGGALRRLRRHSGEGPRTRARGRGWGSRGPGSSGRPTRRTAPGCRSRSLRPTRRT